MAYGILIFLPNEGVDRGKAAEACPRARRDLPAVGWLNGLKWISRVVTLEISRVVTLLGLQL